MSRSTLSRSLRRRQRGQRREQIRQRLETLRVMAEERLNVRKYKRRAYAEEQIRYGGKDKVEKKFRVRKCLPPRTRRALR